jgi:hypothetical protein
MTLDPFKDIKDAWDWLLIQNVATRHYDGLNFLGPRFENLLLNRSIISLLTVALAGFLDEALQVYISHSRTRGKQGTLFDKIETLKHAGKIDSVIATQFHDVRNARNMYAHRAPKSEDLKEKIDWKRLDERTSHVASALRHLGVLDTTRRKYEYLAERTLVESPNEGAGFALKCRYGVKRNGEEAYVHEFVVNYPLRGKPEVEG